MFLFQADVNKYLGDDMVSRTMIQFFLDGYDTLGSSLSMAFYFLTVNPDVQDKVIEEVDKIALTCGETITGDDINDLKYLDQVFSEAGRLAPIPWTYRACTKEWQLPDHPGVVIPKGMRVLIPIYGLHVSLLFIISMNKKGNLYSNIFVLQTDPNYFPEPDNFDPDRFSSENRSQIRGGTFLQFGAGPRQCLGMRIAKHEAKIFIFQILRNYRYFK